jgi:CDP-glycerol glycerophosphotransferase (TagB/SpsB family)
LDRKKILDELGLDKNRRIITIATLHIPGGEARKRIFEFACSAIQRLTNAQFIVKMHPFETDRKTYLQILKKKRIKDYIILRKYDIHKLFLISDIVMTTYSTSGIEAIVLDKPLIIIRTGEQPKSVDYASYGAAIQATGENQLFRAICQIYDDQKLMHRLAKGRKKFIEDYCHKVDGNTSYRISQLINSLKQKV